MVAHKADSNIISSGSEASENDEHSVAIAKNEQACICTRNRSGSRPSNARARSSRSRRLSPTKSHTKHFVEHNYHDHSRDLLLLPSEEEPDSMVEGEHNGEDEITKRRRGGHRGGVAVPFPEKLHYMLSQMDKNETADIVNWQSHGRCFVVHKPKEFVDDIMPR